MIPKYRLMVGKTMHLRPVMSLHITSKSLLTLFSVDWIVFLNSSQLPYLNFSQVLTSLFDPAALERVREAVNSEYEHGEGSDAG